MKHQGPQSYKQHFPISIAKILKHNPIRHLQDLYIGSPLVSHSISIWKLLFKPAWGWCYMHAQNHKPGCPVVHGPSISYYCVLHLSAGMGNSVCQFFQIEQVVCSECPPIVWSSVLTTTAVDNYMISTIPLPQQQQSPSMKLEFLSFNRLQLLMRECIVAMPR